MVTSDLRAEVEMWPFRARAIHPAIIKGTGWCGLGYGATERISSFTEELVHNIERQANKKTDEQTDAQRKVKTS